MKKWIRLIILFAAAAFAGMCGNRAEASVNMDGSVTINEGNFPDERFREAIRCCDKDGDGVLSKEERNIVTTVHLKLDGSKEMWSGGDGKGVYSSAYHDQLEIRSYDAPFSIEGIGYFEQLANVFIKGYANVTGSAKGNKKLMYVGLYECGEQRDTAAIQAMFPLQQLRRLSLYDMSFQVFQLPGAVNLRSLELAGVYGAEVRVQRMDLSSLKKLRTIALHDVSLDKLDLRKNKELVEVGITSGLGCLDYDTHFFYPEGSKTCGINYFGGIRKNCRLILPSRNKIKRIQYFVKGDELDITQCRKLKSLHIGEGVKVKMLRKWYKEAGRRNMCVTVSGDVGKKYKVSRAGKYMKITGKKNWKERRVSESEDRS